jgi:hypothetical protein
VESVSAFVVDQLYLITVAVFAVASLWIIGWSHRRQPPPSGRVGLAGLRTAALASVVPVAVLLLLLLIVLAAFGGLIGAITGSGYATPAPPTEDPGSGARDNLIALLWLVSIPGVTFLAVLDLYAIRPSGRQNHAADAKSFAVVGPTFLVYRSMHSGSRQGSAR